MSQRDDFIADELSVVGYYYNQGSFRCTGQYHYFDCSGLQSWAGNQVGLDYGCTNSSTMSGWCHNAVRPQWMIDMFGPGQGTGLTPTQAQQTKGAWGFHGANEGLDGFGDGGHIKASLGDGRSVEAYDTAEGVIIGTFLDQESTYWALPPGLTGFDQGPGLNPGPGTTKEATDMGFIAKIVPGAHVQNAGPWKGRFPFVAAVLQPDNVNWQIVGFNGAELPGGESAFGMSIVKLGKLNAPIVSADSPDSFVRKVFTPSSKILFLAEDGGTFLYAPTVKYG